MAAYHRFITNNRTGEVTYLEEPPQTKRRWRTRQAVLARIKELEQQEQPCRAALARRAAANSPSA